MFLAVILAGSVGWGVCFADEAILGRVNALLSAENAGSTETGLGLLVAQAVKTATGSDVALVNGGDLRSAIPAGTVTAERVESVLVEDRAISVAEVTPAQLKAILENALSHICLDLSNGDRIDPATSDFGAFPQMAGLSYTYDASALPGERVIKMSIGERELELADEQSVITLAASDYLFAGGWGDPVVAEAAETEYTLSKALTALLLSNAEGLDRPESCMRVIGCGDNSIAEMVFPSRMMGMLLLAFALCFGLARSARKRNEEDAF